MGKLLKCFFSSVAIDDSLVHSTHQAWWYGLVDEGSKRASDGANTMLARGTRGEEEEKLKWMYILLQSILADPAVAIDYPASENVDSVEDNVDTALKNHK